MHLALQQVLAAAVPSVTHLECLAELFSNKRGNLRHRSGTILENKESSGKWRSKKGNARRTALPEGGMSPVPLGATPGLPQLKLLPLSFRLELLALLLLSQCCVTLGHILPDVPAAGSVPCRSPFDQESRGGAFVCVAGTQ